MFHKCNFPLSARITNRRFFFSLVSQAAFSFWPEGFFLLRQAKWQPGQHCVFAACSTVHLSPIMKVPCGLSFNSTDFFRKPLWNYFQLHQTNWKTFLGWPDLSNMPYQITAHKNEFLPARLLASLTLQSISLQSRQWNRKRPERKCGVFLPVTFAIAAWNIQKFSKQPRWTPEGKNSDSDWSRDIQLLEEIPFAEICNASGPMLRKTVSLFVCFRWATMVPL